MRKASDVTDQVTRAKRLEMPPSFDLLNGTFSTPAGLPVIYVITPTYRRPEQMAELTRLGQTLLHVPAIRWVVVEDSESISESVAGLLARLSIPYIHLSGK